MPPAPTALSVSAITAKIKQNLEQFRSIWVEGEISNIRAGINASGHVYFTLKDATAQLSAALFAGTIRTLHFPVAELKDGIQIRARGDISVFEPRGTYQLIIREIEKAGMGDLMAKFEELKKKLEREGLFSAERKRPLPLLPRRIGIVTSPTGAVIRDILHITRRRFPNLHILLAPVKVQGEGAAQEIAEAIRLLNAAPSTLRPDVLIVARGGGSIEDLWCFNDESVARAVRASTIPVISAVGHEIDFTICDFVADLRAPTPSAAAEIVVGCREAFEQHLGAIQRQMERDLRYRLQVEKARFERLRTHRVFSQPHALVLRQSQHLDLLALQMRNALQRPVTLAQKRLDAYAVRLSHSAQRKCSDTRARFAVAQRALTSLNPLAVLSRGYGVTRDAAGRIVRDAAAVPPGATITTQLSKGTLTSTVQGVKNHAN